MTRIHALVLAAAALVGLGTPSPALAAPPPEDLEILAEDTDFVEVEVDTDVAVDVDVVAEAVPDAAREAEPAPDEGAAPEPEAAAAPALESDAEAPALDADADAEAELDPKLYAELLRTLVRSKRDAVSEAIAAKAMDKQLARMDLISTLLSIVGLLGFGLVLSPLWLRKRYPDKSAVLWKYGALSALLFVLTINLFSGVLMVLRTGQVVAGSATSPQVQIVEATFEVIDDKAEDIAPVGPLIIEPTLAQLQPGAEEPLPVVLLRNVQQFKTEMRVFTSIANFFKGVSWIFGYVPIVLSLVTVAVFLLGLRPTLRDIVQLPARAAEGAEPGIGRRVALATLRRLGRELVVTLILMVGLLVVMLTAGALMSVALGPAIEAFLAYLTVAVLYVQVVPDASSFPVLLGLGGTVLFLVLDLAVVITGAALYVGKAHKILQRRFHDGEPLAVHRRFWGWGTLGLAWVLAFPVLYIFAAQPVVEALIDATTSGDEIPWGFLLSSGPVVLVVFFGVFFWLLRGVKAIAFMVRYRVPKVVGAPTVPAPPVPVRTGATQSYAAVHAGMYDPYGGGPPR